jgi:phosphate transport system permease protein
MMQIDHEKIFRKKRRSEAIAFWTFRIISLGIAGVLFWILGYIIFHGIGVINWNFISQFPKDSMTAGGIYPAIIGTLCLVAGSMIFAFPIGVMAGIYMNEYARDGLLKRFIKLMTNNLAGIPSIVFGLFGMSLFVNKLNFHDSILAGSLTLGILVLPIIIRTTEEALKAVDDSFRHGSLSLGASKWQTTSRVVLPSAFPNIITGLILSIGRVSGETAPILFTAVVYFSANLPHSIMDPVMALPYHLYEVATAGTDIVKCRPIAYGTALVLIAIVLVMNILANVLRRYFGKKVKTN